MELRNEKVFLFDQASEALSIYPSLEGTRELRGFTLVVDLERIWLMGEGGLELPETQLRDAITRARRAIRKWKPAI